MTKRRKRGALDPDYRTKGWRDSGFAPRKSSMNITQLSLAVAFFFFVAFYFIPETKPAMMTTRGLIVAGGGAFVIWVALAILIRRLVWRRVRPKQPIEITFEEPEELQEYPPPAPTPPDPIQQQLEERRERIDTPSLKPRDFEHEVAWLINALTNWKAVVVGGAGDGGVDVKVYSSERLVGIVQCKRYNKAYPLSPGHVRELFACKEQFGVRTAYLVTTTRFTPDTEREAKRLNVKLIDGQEYEELCKRAHKHLKERDERQTSVS